MDKNTTIISIAISKDLAEKIDYCAKCLHMKKSQLVRELVTVDLVGVNPTNDPETETLQALLEMLMG